MLKSSSLTSRLCESRKDPLRTRPVIFLHCLRHKEKCRWVATTNERSMSRTIVPAGITRIDNGGEEGQGNRWRAYSIEPAVFLSLCERSTWGWMRSLIWGKLQGVTDRDPLFSVYFRRIAQNVISRLWWRSMRALERSALSLTNCLRFVIGPSKAFRASILDLPCLTRWKVKEDKQRLEGGSLVNEKCVFVNIYGCNSRLIDQKLICQFGKNSSNCIKCVSFKLRVHNKFYSCTLILR